MSKCNDSECNSECNSRCAYLICQSAMTQSAIIQLQVCIMSLEPLCNIPHIAWVMLQVRKCNMWQSRIEIKGYSIVYKYFNRCV